MDLEVIFGWGDILRERFSVRLVAVECETSVIEHLRLCNWLWSIRENL
jgi:hypothetical protein